MIPPPRVNEKHVEISDDMIRITQVHMYDELLDSETKAYSTMEGMLTRKVETNDLIIDILKLNNFYNNIKMVAMTEFLCRRLINKYEYDHHAKIVFEIINGSPEWLHADKARRKFVDSKHTFI